MQLNYKEFGEGFPVIILHGLLGSLDNWQSMARQLADDFKVYTLDQRNHGKSPHTQEHTTQAMANDVAGFFEQHGIEKAHLIGHSMGGKTAMQFALDHPERVAKLVVVDIAPKQYKSGFEEIFAGLKALNPAGLESRKQADEELSKYIPQFAVRQFLLKNLDRTKDGFRWKMNLHLLADAHDNILNKLTGEGPVAVPTLVVRGGRSNYITDADKALFEQLFTPVTLTTINEAGHWVHAESPAAFYDVTVNFLR